MTREEFKLLEPGQYVQANDYIEDWNDDETEVIDVIMPGDMGRVDNIEDDGNIIVDFDGTLWDVNYREVELVTERQQ